MSDPAERLRELREDLRRKATWSMELSRRADHNGMISAEGAAEARKAAGLDPLPEPAQPEPEPEPDLGPSNGGARTDQPAPPFGDEGLKRRIAEAEQAGDQAGAMAAKTQLLQLRNAQMNNPDT
jgi:hypothetical protein